MLNYSLWIFCKLQFPDLPNNEYFEDLKKLYFLEGIKKLERLWNKCVEVTGDYVEK